MIMKLYYRIKINGKWTFRAACECGGFPRHTVRDHIEESEGGNTQ